ncbi:hypothetical protein H257_02566 [Aphanomyces astaci]|uniref:Uncharacterized protein n=1 Tax=Aphanomyces astaci TaxID=112090 RepID=W4H279_APHAT|nr:hypothetical protein H257_02566 [Aphanomyces astaci]ETV86095.1 hypothetical protein H257_02566 [Aphanomyces astaci]|eukprot:XP_009824567.1 hypothetical protein H257_02566 [Aphanomyces astaci]
MWAMQVSVLLQPRLPDPGMVYASTRMHTSRRCTIAYTYSIACRNTIPTSCSQHTSFSTHVSCIRRRCRKQCSTSRGRLGGQRAFEEEQKEEEEESKATSRLVWVIIPRRKLLQQRRRASNCDVSFDTDPMRVQCQRHQGRLDSPGHCFTEIQEKEWQSHQPDDHHLEATKPESSWKQQQIQDGAGENQVQVHVRQEGRVVGDGERAGIRAVSGWRRGRAGPGHMGPRSWKGHPGRHVWSCGRCGEPQGTRSEPTPSHPIAFEPSPPQERSTCANRPPASLERTRAKRSAHAGGKQPAAFPPRPQPQPAQARTPPSAAPFVCVFTHVNLSTVSFEYDIYRVLVFHIIHMMAFSPNDVACSVGRLRRARVCKSVPGASHGIRPHPVVPR